MINLGDFAVEFIKTNHSIQDASALAIYSPVGIVIHTGDFKVDYTPVFGDAIDLQRFAEIGKKGVLALMCESTNAERPGFTMSERTVDMYLIIFLMSTVHPGSSLQPLHPTWIVCSRSLTLHTGSEERSLWKAAVWSMLFP